MRLNVVSDVHGATGALARAADGADGLICLGDLVLFIDYEDFTRGIFADLFGAQATEQYVRLRTARRYEQAREHSHRLWAMASEQYAMAPEQIIEARVRMQYAELFAAMPEPAYLTYGNVDVPGFWPQHLRAGHRVLDGDSTVIDGLRFGFVGGGLRSEMRTPYELDEDVYAAKVAALGEVDVLCSHLPPEVPDLCYDVVARRFERGSRALLEYVQDVQPRLMLFGHVHQPAARRWRVGRTECVNVGHFAGGGAPGQLAAGAHVQIAW